MEKAGRILTRNWDLYDTRNVVYQTSGLSAQELKEGYEWSYREFYRWSSILKASFQHDTLRHIAKHLMYAGGWKKFEPLWNFIIKARRLNHMLPLLEGILSQVKSKTNTAQAAPRTSPFETIKPIS